MLAFKYLLVIALICLGKLIATELSDDSEDSSFLQDPDEANELLRSERSFEKRFLYTGKEQRREAKEKYEEKCERNIISKARHKPRWCPELELWPEWNNWRAKDGILYQNINNRPHMQPMGPHKPNNFGNSNSNNYNNPSNFFNANSNNGGGSNYNRVPYDPNKPFNSNQYPFNSQKGNSFTFNNQKTNNGPNDEYQPFK